MSDLYINLKKDSYSWANEEEVRKGWLKHIENDLGITFHAERHRNDASHNQVIIEFKDKVITQGVQVGTGRGARLGADAWVLRRVQEPDSLLAWDARISNG